MKTPAHIPFVEQPRRGAIDQLAGEMAELLGEAAEVGRPRILGVVDAMPEAHEPKIAFFVFRQIHKFLHVAAVAEKLAAENLDLPGGQMRRAGQTISLRTKGEFATIDEIEFALIALGRQQSDGSWRQGGYPGSTPLIDTCLALLFLKRANLTADLTRKLKTLLPKAAERTIEASWRRIGELLGRFAAQECANLANAG